MKRPIAGWPLALRRARVTGSGAGTLLLLGSSFATLGVALRRRLAARKAEAGYRG
jgi:hypothetical protein